MDVRVLRQGLGLHGDLGQLVLGIPGAGPDLRVGAQRMLALRLGVAVLEVVHEFLDAHGVPRRPLALVSMRRGRWSKPAGVHVDAEQELPLGGAFGRMVFLMGVLLAVSRFAGGADLIQ